MDVTRIDTMGSERNQKTSRVKVIRKPIVNSSRMYNDTSESVNSKDNTTSTHSHKRVIMLTLVTIKKRQEKRKDRKNLSSIKGHFRVQYKLGSNERA